MADLVFRAVTSDGSVVCRAATLDACISGGNAYFTGVRLPLRVFDEQGQNLYQLGIQDEGTWKRLGTEDPVETPASEAVTVQLPAQGPWPYQEEQP